MKTLVVIILAVVFAVPAQATVRENLQGKWQLNFIHAYNLDGGMPSESNVKDTNDVWVIGVDRLQSGREKIPTTYLLIDDTFLVVEHANGKTSRFFVRMKGENHLELYVLAPLSTTLVKFSFERVTD